MLLNPASTLQRTFDYIKSVEPCGRFQMLPESSTPGETHSLFDAERFTHLVFLYLYGSNVRGRGSSGVHYCVVDVDLSCFERGNIEALTSATGSISVTVYDTLSGPGAGFPGPTAQEMEGLKRLLGRLYLYMEGEVIDWGRVNFTHSLFDSTPQQTPGSSDCGIGAAMILEALATASSIPCLSLSPVDVEHARKSLSVAYLGESCSLSAP